MIKRDFFFLIPKFYFSCRFLRNKDRDMNRNRYPKLYYPELYLLEGGYKAFFAEQKVIRWNNY